MRFQVPQFIEIEDKIIGNLTLKQFVYIAGSLGMAFVLYKLLPSFIGILIPIGIIILGLTLAFYKVNNKPFEDILESAVKFYLGSKLYVWKKTEEAKVAEKIIEKNNTDTVYIPKLSDSKLKELSWSLDVKQTAVNNEEKDVSLKKM